MGDSGIWRVWCSVKPQWWYISFLFHAYQCEREYWAVQVLPHLIVCGSLKGEAVFYTFSTSFIFFITSSLKKYVRFYLLPWVVENSKKPYLRNSKHFHCRLWNCHSVWTYCSWHVESTQKMICYVNLVHDSYPCFCIMSLCLPSTHALSCTHWKHFNGNTVYRCIEVI